MSDNPFSIANSPRTGGQNPFSVGYKPITTTQDTQNKFIPGLLGMLGNVKGSFQGMLGQAKQSFGNLGQGFSKWQNQNNPNRHSPMPNTNPNSQINPSAASNLIHSGMQNSLSGYGQGMAQHFAKTGLEQPINTNIWGGGQWR